MSSFCRVTPSTDLRNPCLVAFRGQAEVKGSLVRKHIDQNERSDLELPQDSERFGTRKHRSSAAVCIRSGGMVEPFMPAVKRLGRPRKVDLRGVVEGLLYIVRTACPWRLLLHDFPNRSTIQRSFSAWQT